MSDASEHGLAELSVAEAPSDRLSIVYLGDPNSVHLRRWAAYFTGRGHRVTLLLPHTVEVWPDLPDRVVVERFSAGRGRRLGLIGALRARRSLQRALASLQPDVLHAHYITVNAWHAWLSGFHPYAVTVWGSDVLIAARKGWRGRLYARVPLRAADLVTGTSEHLARAAVAAGARPERTHHIHFGVDIERFRPGPDPVELRSRLALQGRRVIFSPRSIAPLYHHETVIEALSKLSQDIVVLMARHAADPTELAALERLAVKLGVADRVVVVDDISYADMPEYYRLADVVVSVAASDGGPISIVEALASGRPVVATDLPSVREWLSALDPEAMVPVGDSVATAIALDRLLARSPADRDEFARRGRAAVQARGDQRITMERMELLYRELVASRRKR